MTGATARRPRLVHCHSVNKPGRPRFPGKIRPAPRSRPATSDPRRPLERPTRPQPVAPSPRAEWLGLWRDAALPEEGRDSLGSSLTATSAHRGAPPTSGLPPRSASHLARWAAGSRLLLRVAPPVSPRTGSRSFAGPSGPPPGRPFGFTSGRPPQLPVSTSTFGLPLRSRSSSASQWRGPKHHPPGAEGIRANPRPQGCPTRPGSSPGGSGVVRDLGRHRRDDEGATVVTVGETEDHRPST